MRWIDARCSGFDSNIALISELYTYMYFWGGVYIIFICLQQYKHDLNWLWTIYGWLSFTIQFRFLSIPLNREVLWRLKAWLRINGLSLLSWWLTVVQVVSRLSFLLFIGIILLLELSKIFYRYDSQLCQKVHELSPFRPIQVFTHFHKNFAKEFGHLVNKKFFDT
jgi:hypothetical protein